MGGWGIIAADVIVMANLAQIAGSYSFRLVGLDSLADSTFWSTVAGIVWIIVMTYICYRGIEISARIQYALLGIEVFTLVLFAVFALAKVYFGGAPATHIQPSLSWLSPSGLSLTSIVTATLIAVFIYWGWDTAVATNEEADDPASTPGRAAVLSTVLLLLTYAIVSIAAVSVAGVGATGIGIGNPDNAADVFAGMGRVVFGGGVVGAIMVFFLKITVLTSASASTQTTILPTARTSLSMAAFGAIPRRFARIHPRYLTPTDSTIWMGAVSIIFYVGLTLVSSEHPGRHHRGRRPDDRLLLRADRVRVRVVLPQDDVGQAARHPHAGRDPVPRRPPAARRVLLRLRTPTTPLTTARPASAASAVSSSSASGRCSSGVVLMFIYSFISPAYFRGDTLPARARRRVRCSRRPTARCRTFGLPDSGEMPTVIAPDLSNLPPGSDSRRPDHGRGPPRPATTDERLRTRAARSPSGRAAGGRGPTSSRPARRRAAGRWPTAPPARRGCRERR